MKEPFDTVVLIMSGLSFLAFTTHAIIGHNVAYMLCGTMIPAIWIGFELAKNRENRSRIKIHARQNPTEAAGELENLEKCVLDACRDMQNREAQSIAVPMSVIFLVSGLALHDTPPGLTFWMRLIYWVISASWLVVAGWNALDQPSDEKIAELNALLSERLKHCRNPSAATELCEVIKQGTWAMSDIINFLQAEIASEQQFKHAQKLNCSLMLTLAPAIEDRSPPPPDTPAPRAAV